MILLGSSPAIGTGTASLLVDADIPSVDQHGAARAHAQHRGLRTLLVRLDARDAVCDKVSKVCSGTNAASLALLRGGHRADCRLKPVLRARLIYKLYFRVLLWRR